LKVAIYRDVAGEIALSQFERFVSTLGDEYAVDRTFLPGTIEYRLRTGEQHFMLAIHRTDRGHRLVLPYWRLAPADPTLVAMLDAFIVAAKLSGEVHKFHKGVLVSVVYSNGKPVSPPQDGANSEGGPAPSLGDDARFDEWLRKETLLGCVDLALSRYAEAKAVADADRMAFYEERSRAWMYALATLRERNVRDTAAPARSSARTDRPR
jgi:hypothetical protein